MQLVFARSIVLLLLLLLTHVLLIFEPLSVLFVVRQYCPKRRRPVQELCEPNRSEALRILCVEFQGSPRPHQRGSRERDFRAVPGYFQRGNLVEQLRPRRQPPRRRIAPHGTPHSSAAQVHRMGRSGEEGR